MGGEGNKEESRLSRVLGRKRSINKCKRQVARVVKNTFLSDSIGGGGGGGRGGGGGGGKEKRSRELLATEEGVDRCRVQSNLYANLKNPSAGRKRWGLRVQKRKEPE